MPTVHANGIDINHETQGEGEPLVLIPYLAADQACYAFHVAEYAKHFTCFTVDLGGAGLSSKPEGTYTTELLAGGIAGVRAGGRPGSRSRRRPVPGRDDWHVAGCQAASRVKSRSLHSAWPSTDPFLRVVVEGWRIMAQALGSVTDMAIKGILPWCLIPELYAARPEYVESLADFLRRRPMPPVDAFLRQSEAALSHDARAVLSWIAAPTLITFGRHDIGDVHPVRRAAHQWDRGFRTRRLRRLRARPHLRAR